MAWTFYNLNIRNPYYAVQSKTGSETGLHSAASYWLDDLKRAPIFFDNLDLDSIRNKNGEYLSWSAGRRQQLSRFVGLESLPSSPHDRNILTTIDEGWVWIYEVVGPCKMAEDQKHVDADGLLKETPKAFAIKLLKKTHVKDVPLVLSSMKNNTNIMLNTFRKISREKGGAYEGNVAAIQAMIGEQGSGGDWEQGFKVDPLDCLSSLEFETLIAKLLEEAGCFVPAYKGGYLRDVDLIAKALSKPVDLVGLTVDSQGVAIQLKMWLSSDDLPALAAGKVQYLVGLNDDDSIDKLSLKGARGKVFGRSWIRQTLQISPKTREWLLINLSWLPMERRSMHV